MKPEHISYAAELMATSGFPELLTAIVEHETSALTDSLRGKLRANDTTGAVRVEAEMSAIERIPELFKTLAKKYRVGQ